MAKILIIYAHPQTEGHCPLILEKIKSELDKQKQNYDLIDLYKEGYDPVLHENEHYTSGGKDVSSENKNYQDMISKADRLIFIYPVWWASMPAILKGFIDRVFVAGYGFKFKGSMPVGLLKGKKGGVLLTTGTGGFIYNILGKPANRLIKRDILNFCGIKTKVFHIGHATRFNKKQEDKIDDRIKKCISYLFR